jgi:hypothetical protein
LVIAGAFAAFFVHPENAVKAIKMICNAFIISPY